MPALTMTASTMAAGSTNYVQHQLCAALTWKWEKWIMGIRMRKIANSIWSMVVLWQAIQINATTFINCLVCWCNWSLACEGTLLWIDAVMWAWVPWVLVQILGHNHHFLCDSIHLQWLHQMACSDAQCKVTNDMSHTRMGYHLCALGLLASYNSSTSND